MLKCQLFPLVKSCVNILLQLTPSERLKESEALCFKAVLNTGHLDEDLQVLIGLVNV